MIIIYTNNQRLFRVFNSELILEIMMLLAIVTGILTILAIMTSMLSMFPMFLDYHILIYETLILCAMIAVFLVINRVLFYRPGKWLFKIRRLNCYRLATDIFIRVHFGGPFFLCMVVHIHVRCGISLDYARILALSVWP